MRIVRRLVPLASLAVLVACGPGETSSAQSPASAGPFETEEERVLYTLGQLLGENVAEAALSEEQMGPVVAGLMDSALGREPQVAVEEHGTALQLFMQQRILAASEDELREANAFLEAQAALEGATRTDSGIIIQEMTAGTGASPTAEDVVSVHYHGTLRDGAVFDSSVEGGGEPVDIPLSGVIPCWTEALQTMQVGGKIRMVCPPDLAYGPTPRPGIPANSALVFEVELLDIAGD
jgi:FKBP-type peptidyl-prolyl cis-trans isomerase FkpA